MSTSKTQVPPHSHHDVVRPIDIILDGTNYILWASTMTIFLKGRKLWRFVSGDISQPEQHATESKEAFLDRLEDWESSHCKILSWFINTSVSSIHSLLPKLGSAKIAWDFLADRYNCTNDASLQYQIETRLYQLRQESGQSIADFFSEVDNLWDQLTVADPQFQCPADIKLFTTYRDRRKFIHFMMALRDDFEPTRASLLHRTPLPTLYVAIAELISEENRRATMKIQSSNMVMATTKSTSFRHVPSVYSSKKLFCKYCKVENDHVVNDCEKLKKKKAREDQKGRPSVFKSVAVASTESYAPESSLVSEVSSHIPTPSASDIEAYLHQVLSRSSTALSATSGKT